MINFYPVYYFIFCLCVEFLNKVNEWMNEWSVRSIHDHTLCGQWKDNEGLNSTISKCWPYFLRFRRYSVRKHWKSTFSIIPLSFDAQSPGNPREYPHKSYRNSCWASPLIVWVYLHSHFCGGLRKKTFYCEVEYIMVVQSHQRSLISVLIESAYVTSY